MHKTLLRALLAGLLVMACGKPAADGSQVVHPVGASGSGDAAVPPVDAAAYDAPEHSMATKTKTTTVLATAADVFEYKVGNPHFRGRSTLRVTGEGAAEVSFEQSGKTQRYKGNVPANKLDALRSTLGAHPLDGYKPPKRPLVPDEVEMEFTLVNAGTRVKNTIPDNDRHEIEELGDLVDLINEIMSAVSGGKVEY